MEHTCFVVTHLLNESQGNEIS